MNGSNGADLTRITLLGAGLMMLVVGGLHLVAPQMMMEAPAIQLPTANHRHIIRAAYGGAYLGIAAFYLLGLFRAEMRRASLTAVGVIFSGFAFGRLVSIAVDGVPVALYLAVLLFELVFAGLAFAALRQQPR